MANALINNCTLSDIADAIRAKAGTATTMRPDEMPAAIAAIPSGGGSQTFPQLWVNSSPSANFAAQTIQLDLSEYDFIIVRGKSITSDSATDANFIFPANTRMQALIAIGTSGELKFGGNNNYSRSITVSTTGVTFAAATSSANNYCIPLSIYGVKGSFGGAS